MITIDNKFNIGDIIYLRTDANQYARIVVCFQVDDKDILYEVCCGTETSKHYHFEMSLEKNVLMSLR